ncbi:hypothetical protein HY383_01720 [Candidatus Daviesbacteria bacterium]|nr:hypothetical protein [Candidatus Daviesbacteria bacterium]
MEFLTEIKREILNYAPVKSEQQARPLVRLGHIYNGTELVYGIFPYQQRIVNFSEQPLVTKWTEQPVLALVDKEGYKTLAYNADLDEVGRTYGETVIVSILDRIRQLSSSADRWEGNDDF